MCSLIFQPEAKLNLCLNFNESQPIMIIKGYDYKKNSCISNVYVKSENDQSIITREIIDQ